jgi:hypothetical protein
MTVGIILSGAWGRGVTYVQILFPIRHDLIDVTQRAILDGFGACPIGSPALAAVLHIKGLILQQSTLEQYQNTFTIEMAAHESATFAQFSRLCAEKGLLQGCDDVKEGDRPDGVADETTLR